MDAKYFLCQHNAENVFLLWGVQDLGDGRVKIWLADHEGKETDGHITVPMLKNWENEPLPLSVQLTKYKNCMVVAEKEF